MITKKSRRILSIICLVTVVFTIVFASVPSYGASKPTTPNVTVKCIDSNYLKLSWKKCSNATKYYVYRSTINQSTKYKKIATTSKIYYNDKTAKENKKYYYKVKAANSKCTGSFSKVKIGKVIFNGYIAAPDEITIYTGAGYFIPYKAVNCKDMVWYEDTSKELATLNVTNTDYGDTIWTLTEKVYAEDKIEYINLTFAKHESLYKKKIKVNIKGYNSLPSYPGSRSGAPDFGVYSGTPPIISDNITHTYPFKHYKGTDASQTFEGYCKVLKAKGFKHYQTEHIGYEETRYFEKNGYIVVVGIAGVSNTETAVIVAAR